jgi:hypothetical protein
MILGIVGSEEAKFTPETEEAARLLIRLHLKMGVHRVVSGGCHLGGIDIWAVEEASRLGILVMEYLPRTKNWEGYKARNMLIAENSDQVICITVKVLPPGYKVRGFEKYCYHCKTDQHVKSGGCWTTKYARKLGKVGRTLVIDNDSPN